MSSRPEIPRKLKRQVLIESGHRCAIPTCRHTTVEIAHIIPYNECKEHKFDNLIALCPNCHSLYDRDERIDRISMLTYKKNLIILNSRYCTFELRLLEEFLNNSEGVIALWGREIDIMYLVKDGLIIDDGKRYMNSAGFPPKGYKLTEKGKTFIQNYQSAKDLSDID